MREYATQAEGAYELSGKEGKYGLGFISRQGTGADGKPAQCVAGARGGHLNHFRVSAAMFRWGYRILGIIAALVAAIMLAVGLIERNLIVVLFGVVLIYKEIKLCKPKFNGSYVSAYAEVEAAVAAVRRGESGSFPPEYTPDTQKLREPMLGAICGKLAVIAGFLLFCAVAFAGMGVLGIAFVLVDVDFRELFWLFVPLSVLFALIGAPLGAAGVVYARSAWAVRKR